MTTLNLSNYATVWNDNFTNATSLPSNFGVQWGDSSEYSYGSNGLTLTSDGNAAGFLTADSGPSSGTGYGLYSATFTMPTNQANGAYICLWPGSNVWPGPEIDFVEQLGSSDQPYMTVHWAGANGSNQYQSFNFNANLANPTTVAMDWEKGSLTFYVNGTELVKYVSGGSVPIPADYADGGQNLAFGVGNVGPAGTALTISDMSYSTYTGGSGGGGGTSSIVVSAPGTVQEASVGAGVNVTETVTATGVSTVYEQVRTSAGVAEGNWQAVTLNGSGTGSFTAHFAHTGDYIVAVDKTASPTVTGNSAAITITDKGVTPSINVSSPGTAQEASPGAGVNITETITATGVATVYEAVFTTANVAEANWQAVTLNSSGVGTFTSHFLHTGDYIVAINDPTTQSVKGWSTPVTITDKTATTPTNVTLTGDNLYTNSAAGTVIGTLSATDPNSVSYALSKNWGGLFALKGNQLVLNRAMPATPKATYGVTVVATDSTGGQATQVVKFAALAPPAAAVAAAAVQVAGTAPITSASVTTGGSAPAAFLGGDPGAAHTATTMLAGANGSGAADFGTGNASVSGGPGAWSYTYSAGDGLDTISNFSALKGDVLNIDHTLRGALHESTAGGGTMLSFGDASHGILLPGVASLPASQLHWF